MSRAKTLLPLLVIAGLSGHARADDPPLKRPSAPAALEHLSQATKLYKVRSFEEAAAEYKAGALIEPAPIFDYNLGQCFRQLHRYDDAIWHYEQFISSSPQTPEHVAAAQKFIDEMRAEKAQSAMSAPPLEPATPAQPSAPVVIAPVVLDHRDARVGRDWVAYGLIGGGAISIGVSAGLFVTARSLHDDGNSTHVQTESNALHDRADTRTLAGAIVAVAGVGLATAGAIKLVLHQPSPSNTALNVGISANGILVFGRF